MTLLQYASTADIRLLFLKHCSPCAQRRATSAQTRAVGLLLMTQLIQLLTTTSAAYCPPGRTRHSLTPELVLGLKPLLPPSSLPGSFLSRSSSPASRFSRARYTLCQRELASRGQYQGQAAWAAAADGIKFIRFLITVLLPLLSLSRW